jgi:hypothetical protein
MKLSHSAVRTRAELYEMLKASRQQSTYLPLSIIADTIRDALHEDEDIAVLIKHLSI